MCRITFHEFIRLPKVTAKYVHLGGIEEGAELWTAQPMGFTDLQSYKSLTPIARNHDSENNLSSIYTKIRRS